MAITYIAGKAYFKCSANHKAGVPDCQNYCLGLKIPDQSKAICAACLADGTVWSVNGDNDDNKKTKMMSQKARGFSALKKYAHLWAEIAYLPEVVFKDAKLAGSAEEAKIDNYNVSKLATNARCLMADVTGINMIKIDNAAFLPPDVTGAIFVRPCPQRPRHGFVESRSVVVYAKDPKKAIAEINTIFDEARTEDDKAEIMLMPYIPAEYSIVATSVMVAVGAGNDGATSGHDTLTLPLMETEFKPKELLTSADVKECPYFEAVVFEKRLKQAYPLQQPQFQIYLVQLRDGVKPPSGLAIKDYVPFDVTVKRIAYANGTLIRWEQIVGQLKGEKGVVVYHPGGTIVSHYAVHCMANGIPIVTTFEPKIGQKIKANEVSGKTVKVNRTALINGILEGLSTKGNNLAPASSVALMLYALHNASALDLSDPFHARILGYGLGSAVTLSGIACLGELRHGSYNHAATSLAVHDHSICDRETSYAKHIKKSFNDFWPVIATYGQCFGYIGWMSSIGGYKWHQCAEGMVRLWNSVCCYANDNEASHLPMLAELNRVINLCHNAAKMLTKFTGGVEIFNAASSQPIISGIAAAVPAYKLWSTEPQWEKDIEFKPVNFVGPDEIGAYCGKLALGKLPPLIKPPYFKDF